MECNKSWWEINGARLYPLSTKQDPFLMCLQSFKLKAWHSLCWWLMSSSLTPQLQVYVVGGYKKNYEEVFPKRPTFVIGCQAPILKMMFIFDKFIVFAKACDTDSKIVEWQTFVRSSKKNNRILRLFIMNHWQILWWKAQKTLVWSEIVYILKEEITRQSSYKLNV